jgi:hypothetical protein
VGEAKRLIVKPISASDAGRMVRQLHYSGKIVNNSQLHLGVFLDGKCGGAMQFGPSLDKRKTQGLVEGTLWNEFLELNRMAFADWLPRNGESRALGFAMRWIRKTYPHIKWVVSFADGAQCGDGTIYRASGFVLTSIKKNTSLWSAPNGGVIADATIKTNPLRVFSRTSLTDGKSKQQQQANAIVNRHTHTKGGHTSATNGGASMRAYRNAGFAPIPGFQLRYVFFLDPACRQRLTVPILPFSEIERRGAGMYKGKPISRAESIGSDAAGSHPAEGGAVPTSALNTETPNANPPR